MERKTPDLSIYIDAFKDIRERWLAGYFSWTESKDITEAELHTARDGFDAGANWQEKLKKEALTASNLIKHLRELPAEARAEIFLSFCKHCYRHLETNEQCHCWNDE